MKKTRLFIIIALVVVAFVGVTVLVSMYKLEELRANSEQTEGTILADYGEVIPFTLTERSGQPLSHDDLKGQIWIADFIFTNCAGPCPMMTARMAELQKEFADVEDLRFVSFSVDPERDTPEVMAAYGDRYGADPERWYFLTGDKELLTDVAVDAFHVGDREDPLLHSTLFAMVDQSGTIRGFYHSDEPNLIRQIRHDINLLLADPPA